MRIAEEVCVLRATAVKETRRRMRERLEGRVRMGKRGRTRKRKGGEAEEEGEAESGQLIPTGFHGVSHQQVANPTPSSPGLPSSLVHYPPTRSRYQTRHAKMVLGQCAKLGNINSILPFQTQVSNTPVFSSRSPSQNVKREDHSQSHWHTWLAKRGKIIENIDSVSAKSEGCSIPKANDLLDIEKLTSKLLHQSQSPEKPHPADPPSAPYALVLDNHLPNREATEAMKIIGNTQEECANNLDQNAEPTQSLSLNITEMAAMLNDDFSDPDEVASAFNAALVTVNGYRVKEEFASLLRDIISKYGDIAKGSSLQSERSRSSFLEMVCGIFQRLEGTKFTDITTIELKSMLDIIGDIEFVKLEVGWLHMRLHEIYEAKLLFKGSSSLKEAKTRNSKAIEKIEKEVEGYKIEMQMLQEKISLAEDKMAAIKAESEKINGTALDTKTKVKCFYQRSLVDGLL